MIKNYVSMAATLRHDLNDVVSRAQSMNLLIKQASIVASEDLAQAVAAHSRNDPIEKVRELAGKARISNRAVGDLVKRLDVLITEYKEILALCASHGVEV